MNFEPQYFNVTTDSLSFYADHPEWGELYFSAYIDGARIELQTIYELGGGSQPVNADKPSILGDLIVKGHIFRDVELYLAFLH